MKLLVSPSPSIFFTAILAVDNTIFTDALSLLSRKYGKPLHILQPKHFRHTDYYASEMGSDLIKGFIAFEPPFDQSRLLDRKLETRGLEWALGYHDNDGFHRQVNIDPGYISLYHVALATSKNFSHRVYLGEGIYGEVTLLYRTTGWELLPWTYPDYKILEVQTFLSRCRESLKQHIENV